MPDVSYRKLFFDGEMGLAIKIKSKLSSAVMQIKPRKRDPNQLGHESQGALKGAEGRKTD